MAVDRFRVRRIDTALLLLVCGTTVFYFATLPRHPPQADEAMHLLEARRIWRGQVMYRDFFDLAGPVWPYLVASLFSVFGVSVTTARLAAAVIQGLIAGGIFLISRGIAICRSLAVAAAVSHVVVAQAVFPVASYHWLGTLLTVGALYLLLVKPDCNPKVSFQAGLVIGILMVVHQGRGMAIAMGAAAIVLAEVLLAHRYGRPARPRDLIQRWSALGVGIVLVVAPTLLLLVAYAGIAPVWAAMVIQPLVNYRHAIGCPWGFNGSTPIRAALRFVPVALAFSLPRALVPQLFGIDYQRARIALVLTLFALSSILSIWYYPDSIHIGFIAPGFFIVLADAFETGVSHLPQRVARVASAGLAFGVITAGIWQLQHTAAGLRTRHAFRAATAFGMIDFPRRDDIALLQKIDDLLRPLPDRKIYCHPLSAGTCLLVDAWNPGRFELLVRGYNSAEQYEEVVTDLTRSAVPFIVAVPATLQADDRLARFIREQYAPLNDPQPVARYIWQRKSGP